MAPVFLWKLLLALALAAAIIASASARAPRRPLPRTDLRWLLSGATALYAVGLVALLTHHSQLAVLLFAAGVATSTFAAWLSRGTDRGGGPRRFEGPVDEPPPPDGAPEFDWAQFERELLAYAERSREVVKTR